MAQTKAPNSRSNGKPQAKRYAEQAARKADSRREKADGAAAWVAERAGDWDLDAQDLAFMERQKLVWNPLIDYWFRMEMEGWENLPEPPALLIGVHSGAPFVPIAISAPWGIGPALLPEVPLPAKIRTAFQEPVKVANDPAKANDEDYVSRKYDEVQSSIQRGMDALARRRRLPLFG